MRRGQVVSWLGACVYQYFAVRSPEQDLDEGRREAALAPWPDLKKEDKTERERDSI